MKIQTAASILIPSALIMVGLILAGNLVASAQQQQRPAAPPSPAATGPTKAPPAAPVRAGQASPSAGSSPSDTTEEEFRRTPPGARVTFNLEDADLPDLVRLISNITGRRFILPGKLRSIKATVIAPTKVTAAEAYRAFLSILQLNGMAVVPAGRYLKIVESSGIESQPIPTYTGDGATPRDDRYLTRMHRVENVSAEDVATLLGRFKSREGNVTAYAPTNTVIITDIGSNIRRMVRIMEAVDVPRTGEQIWIEPIHYANATELAERLQEIFGAGSSEGDSSDRPRRATPRTPARSVTSRATSTDTTPASDGPSTVGTRGESRVTKILPDERTNSLIILATERAYLRTMELIRQLDQPLEGEGRIHVHYLQHGDSEEVATTLGGLIGGAGSSRPPTGRGPNQGSGATAGASADIFEGQIRVTAHAPSNALVITSSLHDYAALRRVIDRLDAPRRQVFIEAVIMELSVNRSRSLGISFHGGAEGLPTDGSLFLAGSNATGSLGFPLDPTALTGLALGVRGPEIEGSTQLIGASVPGFGVAINALATSGDADILSTPHIIAMDNEEAEISVGANVPLQTSGFVGGLNNLGALGALGGQNQQQTGAAGLAGLAGLAGGLAPGTVPRQDVGTTIRLTPHINESDEIRFEIEEEISEAQASTEGTLGVRSINQRTAKTQMVVRDQQTVVIGGLMRDRLLVEESKIPILGDIPLLGLLFRQKQRTTEKTNLLLFLTPYIIRDSTDLRSIFERKMRERQEFIDRFFVFGDHDYEPAVDYSRTRGLLAEIINEVDTVKEERALLEAAQAARPAGHEPRPPVGAAPEVVSDSSDDSEAEVVIAPGGDESSAADEESAPAAPPAASAPEASDAAALDRSTTTAEE